MQGIASVTRLLVAVSVMFRFTGFTKQFISVSDRTLDSLRPLGFKKKLSFGSFEMFVLGLSGPGIRDPVVSAGAS